ncbi:hypothetical protein AXK11_00105 [Cephaloticoccus primus]|uniref:Uncharacterized protein n=1 Tax=Cephaloticoccus primus TaxID=1548207 RepID=A0A139SSW9_9BACT|nr:hypothetical protein [Cephaloticoccus primus]KXU37678.1 hypothetical protein AXK11_00105 [Cephaloticoccus primus]
MFTIFSHEKKVPLICPASDNEMPPVKDFKIVQDQLPDPVPISLLISSAKAQNIGKIYPHDTFEI